MDPFWVLLAIFIVSLCGIAWERSKRRGDLEAQFVVTGCILFVFYAVCFFSGICTILNFLWRWVF